MNTMELDAVFNMNVFNQNEGHNCCILNLIVIIFIIKSFIPFIPNLVAKEQLKLFPSLPYTTRLIQHARQNWLHKLSMVQWVLFVQSMQGILETVLVSSQSIMARVQKILSL